MSFGISSIGYYAPRPFGSDEDSFTLALESTERCLEERDKSRVGACYFGSETRPYSVKSAAAMVASSVGLKNDIFCADVEFACKSGTSALQAVAALIEAGRIESGLAIGSDSGKADSSDPLFYSVGSGAVSVLLSSSDYFCEVLDYSSVVEDVADFWRAKDCATPKHEGRFTGEGGYLRFTETAYRNLVEKNNVDPDYIVFHMPNKKFPYRMIERLGLDPSRLEHSMIFEEFGNCFAACALLGLHACLEKCGPNETIALVSYGSGAGSDAFLFRTNEMILDFQSNLVHRIW